MKLLLACPGIATPESPQAHSPGVACSQVLGETLHYSEFLKTHVTISSVQKSEQNTFMPNPPHAFVLSFQISSGGSECYVNNLDYLLREKR